MTELRCLKIHKTVGYRLVDRVISLLMFGLSLSSTVSISLCLELDKIHINTCRGQFKSHAVSIITRLGFASAKVSIN